MDSSDDLVTVAVPRRRLLDVYRLLAEEPGSESPGAVVDDGRFDRALIERAYRESPDSMRRFFKYLADRPGRMVPNTELVSHMGITRPKLAGALGAFGRRWRNRYRQGDGKWFFEAEWQPEDGSGEWKWHYGVSTDVAEIVKDVASS
jgi:hypothetical protein